MTDACRPNIPDPLLRLLPVDLDELSSLLEDDPVYGGRCIDLRTGDTWPAMMRTIS